MTNVKKVGCAAAVLALMIAVGCGEGGGSSSPGTGPSAAQVSAAQTADAGGQAVEQTEGIATEAVVEAGAPGTTSTKSGGASMAPTSSFNFQGTVSVTVDLDMLNSSGQDAFPNATGRFSVDASGTITGNEFNGQADYAVTVAWITDGTFTDPVCGASATITAGSSWNYTLKVQWSRTDDLNWSIQATSDVNGQASGSVTDDGQTWTVNGTVQRHATASFSRVAGNYQFSFGVNGEKTIIVSKGSESHTVVITMSALDHILITVDGVTFGPYTLAQVWWWWHFNCNG